MGCKRIIQEYTFDASAQTITFDGYATINLENVLLVTHLVSNNIIYNFADPSTGGTVATNVLTLDYNTTSMNDADELQIYYWEDTQVTLLDEASATISYVGKAPPGASKASAVWQISRLDASSITIDMTYADGNDLYDNIWNNRASLSYS